MQYFKAQTGDIFTLNCRGKLVELHTPKVMGILNLTPDSFSDGGKFNDEKSALLQAEKMVIEGAEILDIGAQSTRPNAEFLSAAEEIGRLGKIISKIRQEFPDILISLDTFYGDTVKYGASEGIDIVNDISGGQFDKNLLPAVAETQLSYILMHVNPSYEEMHSKVKYVDIILEINRYFSEKVQEVYRHGINDVILDPGFGFGKTVEDQYQMIDDLEYIGFGKLPLLVGISRKSFIYKPSGKLPTEVNTETQQLHLKMLKKGAKILRVHDVAEAKKTIKSFLDRL